jgi:UDP-glucose 4-epimerase
VGGTEEVTILELAQRIQEKTHSSSEIVLVPYGEAYEAGFEDMRRRIPDISKIRDLIGYRPSKSLDQSLDRVIEHVSTAI